MITVVLPWEFLSYYLQGYRGGVTMPSDFSSETHSLAATPTRIYEDGDTRSPLPLSVTTGHTSSSSGGELQLAQENPASSVSPSDSTRVEHVASEPGDGARVGTSGGVAASFAPPVNLYRLTPELRGAFAQVGATDRAYSFKEVVLLLKKYLFSNVGLFDPNDRLYVNCEFDPLGKAFGVKRFHFNDVRSLISNNIIKNQVEWTGQTNDNATKQPLPPSGALGIPVNEIVQNTSSVAAASSSLQNPSRLCTRNPGSSSYSRPFFTFPEIPDSCSDTETIYSYQGYETEYCRNTEFEFTEEEEEVNSETYVEYELPSDDDKDEREEFSDSNSSIDDAEIAVIAMVHDEIEEGFWADDDSDTDEEEFSDEDDPDCVSDRWDCLTCGLKNKPFVRYCDKCWQLRKNWLPDRPRKRKRKPRPKKRNLKKAMESVPSGEQSSSQDTVSWKDQKTEIMSENSADEGEQLRTASISTTISSSSTQDSGFSTQEMLESQDTSEEFCVENRLCAQKETVQPKEQAEDTVLPINRKRKSSNPEDYKISKRMKRIENRYEAPFGDTEVVAESMFRFISSNEGKEWMSSPSGLKFARSLQSSPVYQEALAKIVAEQTSVSISGIASGTSMLCSICCLRPKNASIIHGKLAHQATCYQCARRLLDNGARCPVCRRKIHMVCKQILA